MRRILLHVASPLLLLGILALVLNALGGAKATCWLAPDEFGRAPLAVLALAMLLSLCKGLVITTVIALVSSVVAYVAARGEGRVPRFVLRLACAVVESVPLVLWVAIIVVSVRGPRLWVTLVAFGVLTMPTVMQVFLGEFMRLRAAPFVEAAYLLGLSEARVFARYLLPAATPVLVPLLIQVLGSAIAIDGAIGVLGLGNRSDIDLGVFLLRGKEQFVTRPLLLAGALAAYGLLYLYLQRVAQLAASAGGTRRTNGT
jgi:ABC-type dipeptide/oligopeptide/nickel transport system permease subunit